MRIRLCRHLMCLLLASIVCASSALIISAQFSQSKLDAIRQVLKPLEMTKADVERVLLPGSLSSWNRSDGVQIFYREDETIDVRYSSGNCGYDDYEFMPFDAWKVPKDTLVAYSIEPKDELLPSNLGVDLSTLRKERLFRSHKSHSVYFDKKAGFAVYLWSDEIDSLHFFPSSNLTERLCDSSRLRKYFGNNKWRFTQEPKNQAVDFNFPATVTNLDLSADGERRFSVVVTSKDPENDVLTFNYFISVGRIVGKGAKVTWDLSDVTPGTYTLTAAVDDGIGFRGRYLTKSITIK